MKLKPLLAVTATAFTLGIATATLFDFSAAVDESGESAFSLAPLSLGHPAAAATLQTHRDGLPAETAADVPLVKPAAVSEIARTVKIKSGDTLAGILVGAGVGRKEAAVAVSAFADAFDPRDIRAGHSLTIRLRPEPETGTDAFLGFSYEPSTREVVSVERNGDGFAGTKKEKTLAAVERRVEGTINDSLYMAGVRNDLPLPILIEMIRAYSWDVDFQRDIRVGDHFTVLFEDLQDENGNVVDHGAIQYAQLTLSGQAYPVYRYETAAGNLDYFNDKGQSAKKALMRTPIDGARLSSGFGTRKHPVLGYTKMHKGVDFAAPSGTPIYAAGDGVIEFAGWNGGYGKLVRIRHNGEYKTQYAHMKGFAKIARVGNRVRQGQVIGYVGTTGRSTGPHLHYEVVKAGKQVNPMKVKMPSGEKLKGEELERFLAEAAQIDRRFAALDPTTDVASRD